MTPTEKGKASPNPRRGSSVATKKKAAGGKRKPRTAGKTSTAAAKPNAASKPAAKKTTAKPAAKKAAAKPPAAKTVAKAKPAWEPQIIVFACNWCSYAGADTAGVSRIQHQPNFRMIRVMCSGRIQPAFVLRAFEKGADGVLVSGCHFGDCHYIFGNERAAEQFEKTMNMIKLLGIEEGRKVRVMAGPLKDMEGVFRGYLRGGQRARVLMEFLRRRSLVEVETELLAVVRA